MEKQTITKRKTTTKREIISKGVCENGEIKLSGKRLPKKNNECSCYLQRRRSQQKTE